MNFKKSLFLFSFFLCNISLFSQTISISGSVKDIINEPVAFANILVLQSQDSIPVTGVSSDENGNFNLENIKLNTYILKTSFIGFKDNFKAIDAQLDINNISIILEESIESLNEVRIMVERPTLKREADRLVFKVENTALSQGNLAEVLRSTPSVLVLDNAILVKNATPVVYINDRRVHLSSAELIELLQGTSAANIKSVEVITNPPAKYDADSGVVLNIVMSKNLITGYNGSVFSNYTQGVFPRSNFGTSHYFKGSKANVFFNYSYNSEKIDRVDNEQIFYPDQEWNTVLDKNTWSETHNVGLNFDYQLSEKSNIAITTNALLIPYYKYLTRSITDVESNSSSFDRINSNSLSRDNKYNLGFDLDYSYNINEASKMSFNSHYTNYDYQRKQDVNSDYIVDGEIIVDQTAFNVSANQDTEIFTSQLDYALNLGNNTSINSGIKYSNVKTNSNILQNDIISGEEVLNTNNTNIFEYNEDVYAAFLDYSYKGEKFNLNAGLRAEQTSILGVSASNEKNTQDYLEFFPTVSLSWQVSEKVYSYFNYKRSILRPDYNLLNPFVYYLNDNTIVAGNPNLKPVFDNYFAIGTTLNNKFTFDVYYKKAENNIFYLLLQDNDENVITYTPGNIESTEEIGFDFEVNLYVTKKWYLYFGTSTYNYKDTGIVSGSTLKLDKWANFSILNNSFSFLKDDSLKATLSITYIGENVQGFQTSHESWNTYFSIAKTVFKDKGTISLAMSDLFNKQDFSRSINFLDQRSKIFNDIDSRYIKLGFRYKFGNTKLTTNERVLTNEEQLRLEKKH